MEGDERCVCQRQKIGNQMLKQVQHDSIVQFSSFCHPELVSGSRFWVWNLIFKAPPCRRGSLPLIKAYPSLTAREFPDRIFEKAKKSTQLSNIRPWRESHENEVIYSAIYLDASPGVQGNPALLVAKCRQLSHFDRYSGKGAS